jgi:hypothetical protein
MRTYTLSGAATFVDLYVRYQSTSKAPEEIAQVVRSIVFSLDKEGAEAMRTYIRNKEVIMKCQTILKHLPEDEDINWKSFVGGAGTATLDGIRAFIDIMNVTSNFDGSSLLSMVNELNSVEAMQLSVCARSQDMIFYCRRLLYYSTPRY